MMTRLLDLSAAMKARDRELAAVLRTAIAAIDNAEAVEGTDAGAQPASNSIAGATHGIASSDVARRDLDAVEVAGILWRQIEERRNALLRYDEHG